MLTFKQFKESLIRIGKKTSTFDAGNSLQVTVPKQNFKEGPKKKLRIRHNVGEKELQ